MKVKEPASASADAGNTSTRSPAPSQVRPPTTGRAASAREPRALPDDHTMLQWIRDGVAGGEIGTGKPAVSGFADVIEAARRPRDTPLGPSAASKPAAGQPLDDSTRGWLESRLGANLDGVRVHTDGAAAASARSLDANAYTTGRDIYFGAGAYRPETAEGRALIAHEATHVVQGQRTGGPTTGRDVSAFDDDAEHEARQVAAGAQVTVRAAPAARIHRDPISKPAPKSAMALAADLESSSTDHGAALAALAALDTPEAWTVILRGLVSDFPDVREGAEASIRRLAKNAAFRNFLREQAATPRAMTTDLALMAERLLGEKPTNDPEEYKNVIRQRLDLALVWIRDLTADFNQALKRLRPDATKPAPTSPAGESYWPSFLVKTIFDLRRDVDSAAPEQLAEVGVRASTVIERLVIVRQMAAVLKAQSAQLKEPGEAKEFFDKRLVQLLNDTGHIGGRIDDPFFRDIASDIQRFPNDMVKMLAGQIVQQFSEARQHLVEAIDPSNKPLPSFKDAWTRYRAQVLLPMVTEIDGLVKSARSIEALAPVDAARAFDDLQALGPQVEALGTRVQAATTAAELEDKYTDLVLTDDEAKDILVDTEDDIKIAFALFAQLSADTSLTPAERQKRFEDLANDPHVKDIEAKIKWWHEILEGEFRFAVLLGEVATVVLSIYSGGIAGGVVRGLLGRGVTLAGRIAIGAAVVGAEATAFTMTSRLLHLPFGGKLVDDKLLGEIGENALLFGLLRGGGAVYDRLIASRLPTVAASVGKATLTFSMFQAWTVGLHRWESGEWLGFGDARFWKLAAKNALFLGAVHVGMGIAQPLMAPVTARVLALAVEKHNARCAALGASIDTWKSASQLDFDGAVDIARRSRALYLERLDILRTIHQANPKDFTADELKEAEKVLTAQARAAEETMFQGRARMVAHDIDPSVFFYEGDAEEIRKHYVARGYKVVDQDARTGRLRLIDPDGKPLDLIRSRFGTTGAGRRPTAAEAEKIYESIRKAAGDTAAIARNTGLPEGALRIIRQHVFFAKHERFDPVKGEKVTQRFDADEEIAQLWSAAMAGKLEGDDLAAFRRLMAHEYVEAMLMRKGLPYQDPKAWVKESDGTWTYRPGPGAYGAHDLAPRVDLTGQTFGHYEALKVPLKNAAKLPIEPWMGIPPEDLITIDDPRTATALADLATKVGTDVTRKVIAAAARAGTDPSLAGTIERLAKLPSAEAVQQAQALVAAMGAKPDVPAVVERGAPFKKGGTAQLYEAKGQPGLLVKPAGGRMSKEAQALVDLESMGIPTPYAAQRNVEGSPSIILQKIDGEGSKDIIGRVSSLRSIKDAKSIDLVTRKTIDDLHRIYDLLVKNKVNVGDFQFIVRKSDGAVFVNDPTGLTFNSTPSTKIRTIISQFEGILKRKEAATP